MTIQVTDWVTDPFEHWKDVSTKLIISSMGLIPSFITDHDIPAAAQVDNNYSGGWNALPGWKMEAEGKIQYPGDSPMYAAAQLLKEDGERVIFFPGARVCICQPNGDFEVAIID